jgi:hypothetical protein
MTESDDRIRQIQSFDKPIRDARLLERLVKWGRRGRLLLKLLKIDPKVFDDASKQLPGLIKGMEELASIPDRFNDAFLARGWIMYESFNPEVALKALDRADTGDIEGGEQILVDHFSEEEIRFNLLRLKSISTFQPRSTLAEKALIDYAAGRYYASVMVVLSLTDGFANDVGRRVGFFAKDVDLWAWDSIAGHDRGLKSLAKVFGAPRGKTTAEVITIPFRHGIVHGRDLGYDNKAVAAKAWAALFATGDWASRITRGERDAPPAGPPPTLKELLQARERLDQETSLMASWKPRQIAIGSDVPATGLPADYGEGTPERAVMELLAFWKSGNYGEMVTYLSQRERRKKTKGRLAGEIREIYQEYSVADFRLESVTDHAPALAIVSTVCTVSSEDGQRREIKAGFRVIHEATDGNPVVAGAPGGDWRILNVVSADRPFP